MPAYDPMPEIEALAQASAGHGWLAARLEADPDLAALWRAQVAVIEAARSAWLDGFAVREEHVVALLHESRPTDVDPTGLRIAEMTYRTLAQPPALDMDGLRRLETRGASDVVITSIQDNDGDEPTLGVELAGEERHEAADRRQAYLDLVARLDRAPLPVLMKIVMAAQCWAILRRGALPGSAQRLMMIAAERRWAARDPLLRRAVAQPGGWIWAPAAASQAMNAATWSPALPGFPARALTQLALWSAGQASEIGKLADWRRLAQAQFTGRRSTSRKRDFVALISRRPILSSDDVASSLSISGTAARQIIADAVAMDLLVEISGRASFRVYTTPFIARMRRPALKPALGLVGSGPQKGGAQRNTSRLPGTVLADGALAAAARLDENDGDDEGIGLDEVPGGPPPLPRLDARAQAEAAFDAIFRQIDEAARHADAVTARSKALLKDFARMAEPD